MLMFVVQVLPLLPGRADLFDALRVQMATAGVVRRTKQLKHDATIVQVFGRRKLLLFPPRCYRALHPYPATHPARGYSQIPGNFSKPPRCACDLTLATLVHVFICCLCTGKHCTVLTISASVRCSQFELCSDLCCPALRLRSTCF